MTQSSTTGMHALDYASPKPMEAEANPDWRWFLAVLTFPSGMFIALTFAKILGWRSGLAGAVISYVTIAGFIPVMIYAQDHDYYLLKTLEPVMNFDGPV